MDFVKKILHQISRKSEAVSQITFDEDYNVPDARPDVGRMIQKKGEVTIGDVQISEGKARVFGGLTFHLLYVSDGERRRICQLSGELPIDETIHLDGLTGGDKVCITWEVEDLNLHLINSRKLGVRAIVTLHAWIEELCDLAVPMEPEEKRTDGKELMFPCGRQKKSRRTRNFGCSYGRETIILCRIQS